MVPDQDSTAEQSSNRRAFFSCLITSSLLAPTGKRQRQDSENLCRSTVENMHLELYPLILSSVEQRVYCQLTVTLSCEVTREPNGQKLCHEIRMLHTQSVADT